MKGISVAALCISTIFFACKKSITAKQNYAGSAVIVINESINNYDDFPSNETKNDSVGIWHNLGVAYVQSHVTVSRDSSLERLTEYTVDFVKMKFGKTVARDGMKDLVLNATADAPNRFDNFIGRLPYRDNVKDYLRRLIDGMQDTTGYSKSPTYLLVKRNIQTIETLIQRDQAIEGKDRQLLLQSAAVARYSIFYGLYQSTAIAEKAQSFSIKKLIKILSESVQDVASFAASAVGGGNDLTGAIAAAVDGSAYAGFCINYYVPLP